jgi:3',5'-cyclic AMP phosphodiesterase CpdA
MNGHNDGFRMPRLGQHPAPQRVVAHLSDPHLLAGGRGLHGVASEAVLRRALDQLEASRLPIAAIVFTGDLTDLGEPEAYETLKAIVEPPAGRLGAEVIWVMGNHDERPAFADAFFAGEAGDRPQDRVYDLDGLRIVALDSTVPGYHHGDLDPEQLDWLRGVLADPAPLGTLLALHHPPLPSLVELMDVLELREQHRLASAIAGSDVRGVLAGHLHHGVAGQFAGVPVSVAASSCYSIDAGAPQPSLAGLDGGHTMNLVSVYPATITHTTVPIGAFPIVSGFDASFAEELRGLEPDARLERFSRKR